MVTALQRVGTAKNTSLATGPRTAAGKARSSKNALRHGMRSELPVIPGERAEEWQDHSNSIVNSLAPMSGIETALAQRVALCLWRLRRITAYETAVTVLAMEDAQEASRLAEGTGTQNDEDGLHDRLAEAQQQLHRAQEGLAEWRLADALLTSLPNLPDEAAIGWSDAWEILIQLWTTADERYASPHLPSPNDKEWLIGLGIPEEHASDAFESWSGWTANTVRLGWQKMAGEAGVSPDVLLARTLQDGRNFDREARHRVVQLEKAVKDLSHQVEVGERLHLQARMVPGELAMNKITRYEHHLSRQMLQALHTLERLQAARSGLHLSSPAVLDVTVDVATNHQDAN
jgi:hypothetical protein